MSRIQSDARRIGMKKWTRIDWLAIVVMVAVLGAVAAGAASVYRLALVEWQEVYDLDTGESYGRVQVSGTAQLPPGRQNARIGFRPTQYRPGLFSSARTELRLGVACEDVNQEIATATATLAYVWQTGTLAQIMSALESFPEKKTGCSLEMSPARWAPINP